jgi:hypothetical protein
LLKWVVVRGYGGVLSSWEEEGGSVVLMGVLVMRFVDVKDLGKALSDTEHCLVYVNFSLMVGNELCLYKTAIIVLIYSPCHKILAISMVWITRTNVTSLHILPENCSRPQIMVGPQRNRESRTEGSAGVMRSSVQLY